MFAIPIGESSCFGANTRGRLLRLPSRAEAGPRPRPPSRQSDQPKTFYVWAFFSGAASRGQVPLPPARCLLPIPRLAAAGYEVVRMRLAKMAPSVLNEAETAHPTHRYPDRCPLRLTESEER